MEEQEEVRYSGEAATLESYQVRCPVCRWVLVSEIYKGTPRYWCDCPGYREEDADGRSCSRCSE